MFRGSVKRYFHDCLGRHIIDNMSQNIIINKKHTNNSSNALLSYDKYSFQRLDVAGVKHHTERSANGGRLRILVCRTRKKYKTYREISSKLGTHNTVGSMGAGDLSPDNAELISSLRNLGLVDISDFLAKVVVGGLLIIASLNLDKIGVVISVATSTACIIRIYMIKTRSLTA